MNQVEIKGVKFLIKIKGPNLEIYVLRKEWTRVYSFSQHPGFQGTERGRGEFNRELERLPRWLDLLADQEIRKQEKDLLKQFDSINLNTPP